MYSVTDLGTLGGSWSQATGINASGQVVGNSAPSNSSQFAFVHVFRTAPDSPINPSTDDLNTVNCIDPTQLGVVCYALAFGINDSGQIVGWAKNMPDNDPHPFLTGANRSINNPGDAILPNGSGGFFEAVAYGVNNFGQVVGWGDCCPAWGG